MDPQQAPNQQPPTKKQSSDEQDDYEAARSAMQEPYDEYGPDRRPKVYSAPTHKVRNILLILVAVLLIGGGIFYFAVLRKDTKPAPSGNSDTSNSEAQSDDVADEPKITDKTKHYMSSTFGLEFDYPEDWTASEPSGGGRLTVRSPALSLQDDSGEAVTGQVVFTIRNKQQALPEFDKGNAVAARESEKIDYTKPSSVQRGSTYISYLHYAGGTGANTSIDGVYITGDTGYQAGQAIPKADFVPVDPVISLTFVKCADSSCSSDGASLAVPATLWDNKTLADPLKAMLKSLIIN